MWTDRFGYLPSEISIEFAGGSIKSLPDLSARQAEVARRENPDGFAYPPQVERVRFDRFPPRSDGSETEERIPGTERPSLLHRLPASHEITLSNQDPSASCRESDGAFIVHLLGYLFGVRLQFAEWWLDMRIPTRNSHGVHVTGSEATEFVSTAYETWQGWTPRGRIRMTNALYMDARSPCYEWDWEQFTMNYMVFDALYRMAVDYLGVNEVSHRDRFGVLAERFSLARDEERWEQIYRLRNELFHEALWEGTHPCTDSSSAATYSAQFLRGLNHRLIPALFAFETKYVQSAWWTLDPFIFVER